MVQIGLGTVQIGIPYGNQAGGPLMSMNAAKDILTAAVASGIRFFDSAAAYGESESRLGALGLAEMAEDIEVSTKIPIAEEAVWRDDNRYWDFLQQSISRSRERLRISRLDLLQFHQHDLAFVEAPNVRKAWKRLLDDGACQSIGVSVYLPEQAEAALACESVTAVQIPVNLIDQRFVSPKMVELYRKRSARVIARSIFLQGVLVDKAELPPVKKKGELADLRERIRAAVPRSLQSLALAFVFKSLSDVLAIGLLGGDSAASVNENVDLIRSSSLIDAETIGRLREIGEFAKARGLLDPSKWNQG